MISRDKLELGLIVAGLAAMVSIGKSHPWSACVVLALVGYIGSSTKWYTKEKS